MFNLFHVICFTRLVTTHMDNHSWCYDRLLVLICKAIRRSRCLLAVVNECPIFNANSAKTNALRSLISHVGPTYVSRDKRQQYWLRSAYPSPDKKFHCKYDKAHNLSRTRICGVTVRVSTNNDFYMPFEETVNLTFWHSLPDHLKDHSLSFYVFKKKNAKRFYSFNAYNFNCN
jgi:hypothetical protein